MKMKTMDEACADCTRNCVFIHKKRKRPADKNMVPSFFKIMFGPKWSEIMLIPPKVAATMSALINQTIRLEDSSGQCWKVTLSKVNRFLAFQSGWDKFSSENRLREEDILTFDYIRESHFLFRIYGESGLQKPRIFKETRTRKSPITIGNSSQANGCKSRKKRRTSGSQNGSLDKHASSFNFEESESQPIIVEDDPNSNEEVNCTVPVEPNLTARSNTAVQTDNNKFDGDKAKKSTSEDNRINVSDDTDKIQTDTVVAEVPIVVESPLENIGKDKDPLPRRKVVVSDETNFKDEKLKKDLVITKKEICQNPEGKSIAYSRRTAKVMKTVIVDTFEMPKIKLLGKIASKIGECSQSSKASLPIKENDNTISKEVKPKPFTSSFAIPKFKLSGNFSSKIGECGQSSKALPIKRENDVTILKEVKPEPITSFDYHLPNAATLSCVVDRIEKYFFEFTKTSPIRKPRSKGRAAVYNFGNVVYIRDPLKRLNAFLYVEDRGLKVLKGPWKAFCDANNIELGDEISFGLEAKRDNIYTVTKIHK